MCRIPRHGTMLVAALLCLLPRGGISFSIPMASTVGPTKMLCPAAGGPNRAAIVGRACDKLLLARESAGRPMRQAVAATFMQSYAAANPLDNHIKIDQEFPGLRQIYSSPDIYLIDDMLTPEECDSIIEAAGTKEMKVSPVAYAGWTEDAGIFSRLLPIGALPTVNGMMNDKAEPLLIAGTALAIWAGLTAVFWSGAWVWAQGRTKELQELRTSTSVILDGKGKGDSALVCQAEKLLRSSWKTFEAPTVIRYQAGQVLAPHFDANRGAALEDSNRGGQTLVTLLVYLNEVEKGGKTAFGRLGPLTVDPKRGQALLFFPATADGEFDERVEHEGCRAEDEKWIARIWRHADRVPPPYGLVDGYK